MAFSIFTQQNGKVYVNDADARAPLSAFDTTVQSGALVMGLPRLTTFAWILSRQY